MKKNTKCIQRVPSGPMLVQRIQRIPSGPGIFIFFFWGGGLHTLDRHTDRKTDTQTDRLTNRHTHKHKSMPWLGPGLESPILGRVHGWVGGISYLRSWPCHTIPEELPMPSTLSLLPLSASWPSSPASCKCHHTIPGHTIPVSWKCSASTLSLAISWNTGFRIHSYWNTV